MNMKQMLVGKDAISKAVQSIQVRGTKLDKDIHIAGVSCLNHIELHGDITLLNSLVDALPKGSRTAAFKDWALAFGKVEYSTELKQFVYAKGKTTLLAESIEKSWVEFKPEADYKPMNFTAELNKLLKRANERAVAGKGDEIDVTLLAKVTAALSPVDSEV